MNHERDSIIWLGSVRVVGVRRMTELVEVITSAERQLSGRGRREGSA